MKIIVIIGGANTGKSTLLRYLTGLHQRQSIFTLAFTDGNKRVFVKNSAAQEFNAEFPDDFAKRLVLDIKDSEIAFITLRFNSASSKDRDGRRKLFNRGEDYLVALENHGFTIELIVKTEQITFENDEYNRLSIEAIQTPWNLRSASVKQRIHLI